MRISIASRQHHAGIVAIIPSYYMYPAPAEKFLAGPTAKGMNLSDGMLALYQLDDMDSEK